MPDNYYVKFAAGFTLSWFYLFLLCASGMIFMTSVFSFIVWDVEYFYSLANGILWRVVVIFSLIVNIFFMSALEGKQFVREMW